MILFFVLFILISMSSMQAVDIVAIDNKSNRNVTIWFVEKIRSAEEIGFERNQKLVATFSSLKMHTVQKEIQESLPLPVATDDAAFIIWGDEIVRYLQIETKKGFFKCFAGRYFSPRTEQSYPYGILLLNCENTFENPTEGYPENLKLLLKMQEKNSAETHLLLTVDTEGNISATRMETVEGDVSTCTAAKETPQCTATQCTTTGFPNLSDRIHEAHEMFGLDVDYYF